MLPENPSKMESLVGFFGKKKFKFNFHIIPGLYRFNVALDWHQI
jgi:hypothetical protein